jgi:hypothetical protein
MEPVQSDTLRVSCLGHKVSSQADESAENPPPKVVQGYKFNIFYPDLLYVYLGPMDSKLIGSDKSKAPTYEIKKIPGDLDTQIIVFSAGPPYEDIAFRIVRRPWEYSHRSGFRSLFDKGVLQRESCLPDRFRWAHAQCTSTSAGTITSSKNSENVGSSRTDAPFSACSLVPCLLHLSSLCIIAYQA